MIRLWICMTFLLHCMKPYYIFLLIFQSAGRQSDNDLWWQKYAFNLYALKFYMDIFFLVKVSFPDSWLVELSWVVKVHKLWGLFKNCIDEIIQLQTTMWTPLWQWGNLAIQSQWHSRVQSSPKMISPLLDRLRSLWGV